MAKKKTAAKAATKPKTKTATATPPAGELVTVGLDNLAPCGLNPRRTFDKDALEDLAESIAAQGLLQNLVVRARKAEDNGPTFEIIAGERRYRAIKLLADAGRWNARHTNIRCHVVKADDAVALALALLENLQRQDVPPMEEAEGFAQLRALDPDAWSTKVIAERIGKTQRYVQQRLALVERLDPKVQTALRAGEIDLTHARALTVADPKVQREAVDKIKAGYGGYVDAVRLSDAMLGKLPLVSKAPFPVELYTGEIVDGPKPYGARDGRRFLDVEQFKALQKEVVDDKRAKLEGKWAWVEVKKGDSYRADPNYGNYRKSSDKAKAGAVIFVEPDGGVVVKTGLVKVEKDTRSRDDWDARYKRDQEERQARKAAEHRFLLALGEQLAGNPLLAMRVLLAHFLGAGILDDEAAPTPFTARFRATLADHLADADPTGNCRLRDHVEGDALMASLLRLQGAGDDAFLLLAALVAEHLSVGWEGLHPVLAHVAKTLGVDIPDHLRGDEDEIADETDIDEESEPADTFADLQEDRAATEAAQ